MEVKAEAAKPPKVTRYAVDWPSFDRAAHARGAHRLTVLRDAVPEVPVAPQAPARAASGLFR
jgi:hypothetical protein